MATVTGLYTAPDSGEPMIAHDAVTLTDNGIENDRYATGNGHFAPFDTCEVTLIAQTAIDHAADDHGIDIGDGRHRRNVVCEGIDLRDLLDATVRIGDAVIRGTRPRPPCAHLEEASGLDGVAAALTDGRGGICADVHYPGTVAVGDEITILEPDPETVGRRIAARLADGDPERVDLPAPTDDRRHPTE